MNPKILISGPIFDTPSGPSGQGGALYANLKKNGVNVKKASHYRNKILRMLHTVASTLSNAFSAKIILLQSFGLLAFVMEDAVSLLARLLRIPVVFTLRGGAFYEFYRAEEMIEIGRCQASKVMHAFG